MVAVQPSLNDPKRLESDDLPEVIYREPSKGTLLHRPFMRPVNDPKKRLARVLLEGKAQTI